MPPDAFGLSIRPRTGRAPRAVALLRDAGAHLCFAGGTHPVLSAAVAAERRTRAPTARRLCQLGRIAWESKAA
jgi:hypothetical protein